MLKREIASTFDAMLTALRSHEEAMLPVITAVLHVRKPSRLSHYCNYVLIQVISPFSTST